jgi:energy-coupling factor transport system permease protein
LNVAPRYLGRGSRLARRDPRVLILVVILFIFTTIQVWDGRLVVLLLLLALGYYRQAGIPFREVRRNWLGALTLVTFIVVVNSIITGNRVAGFPELHVYFRIPLLGTPISAESLSYAASQWMRYVAMIAVGFPIAFCISPGDLGVAFARLGIPDKLAFGVDLTFRFIPSLASSYSETIDAQRVRGFDPAAGGGGPIGRLRRTMPVLTPLTIGAIVEAEDTIDAMDLRGFGTGQRSWLQDLRFDSADRAVLLFFLALLATATIAGFVTISSHVWVPDAILPR